MQKFLRFFILCALLGLFAPLAVAQQPDDSERPRVLNNYDIAPRTAAKQEKAEKAAEPEKPSQKRDSKASRKKNAVLKAPTSTAPSTTAPKKEGYWQGEGEKEEQKPVAPPEPKSYSELRTNIDDSGRVILTSDTIVIKPEMKLTLSLKPFEGTGDGELDNIIQNSARKHQIDPRLILEVIRQESGFRIRAVSNKGARGLMQLIPSTAARFGVYRIHDPAENVEGGAKYLRFLLDMFEGNLELALAGYNAGENAVVKYNYQIPPYRETRDYVRSITARYRSKYHQYVPVKKEEQVVRTAPLATFTAENGQVILSNNY